MSVFEPNTEGVFFDLPEDVYRSAPGVNVSALKDAITPAHYRATRESASPSEPTPAQVFGRAFHAAALEGRTAYAVKPEGMNFTTKEGKAWRDAQTLPILSQAEAKAIAGMSASLMAHPVAVNVLGSGGRAEVSCFKRDAATGLMLKGRADFLTRDANDLTAIVDLKTCGFGDASEAAFSREVVKWKYHQQAAFYLDLFGASFFLFIAVEKEPPFAVNCFHLDAEAIAKGRAANAAALESIAAAESSGQWNSYPAKLHTLSLPHWA